MSVTVGKISRWNHRILVVDDEQRVRSLVLEVLRDQGFDVVEAGSAMEAMSIVRQSTIDLVISDVHMPAVDGIQLAAMLRGQYPACALLLMSGTVPEPLAKPYPFLPKPFGPRLLLERVNQLLQVRATEDFVDRR